MRCKAKEKALDEDPGDKAISYLRRVPPYWVDRVTGELTENVEWQKMLDFIDDD